MRQLGPGGAVVTLPVVAVVGGAPAVTCIVMSTL